MSGARGLRGVRTRGSGGAIIPVLGGEGEPSSGALCCWTPLRKPTGSSSAATCAGQFCGGGDGGDCSGVREEEPEGDESGEGGERAQAGGGGMSAGHGVAVGNTRRGMMTRCVVAPPLTSADRQIGTSGATLAQRNSPAIAQAPAPPRRPRHRPHTQHLPPSPRLPPSAVYPGIFPARTSEVWKSMCDGIHVLSADQGGIGALLGIEPAAK